MIVSGLGNAGLLRRWVTTTRLSWIGMKAPTWVPRRFTLSNVSTNLREGYTIACERFGAPSLSRPVKAPSISLEIRDTRHTLQTKVSDMDPCT